MILGYVTAFKITTPLGLDYEDRSVPVCLGQNVFLSLEDAKIVLAGEKLKSPSSEWEIFEVHSLGGAR